MAAALLAGLVFGGAAILLLRVTGMERDRATGPLLLAAIALFHRMRPGCLLCRGRGYGEIVSTTG